ncbi:MAG TPA: serine/threonine-protein kinase, partial [Planctomycetota bacterium]|nr:serine/threonine-protein kinase [Planctomycetota bacterium]
MRFSLKILGSGQPRRYVEPGRIFVIGRDPAADLVLEDALMVSKRHCEVEARRESVLVRPVGVAGISINGVSVTTQLNLRAGDQIQVGNACILVESEESEESRREMAAPPPPAPVAAAPALPAALARAGFPRIAGYELLEEIGDVTGNKLYRARQEADGREVAVRVLQKESAADPTAASRVKRLDHPNIVRLLK